MTVRVVVLADTHMTTGGRRRLPEGVYRLLAGTDVILHAGDVVDEGLLATLESIAPTFAVLGNNDRSLRGALPAVRVLDLGGVAVALIHDSGAKEGRARRLYRKFPDAGVVIFGHSHVPMNDAGINGQLLFNPGSPTKRRSSPHHTAGVLEIEDGKLTGHRVVVVDPP